MNNNYNGHTKPTERGYYWYRHPETKSVYPSRWSILEVSDADTGKLIAGSHGDCWDVESLPGEWSTKLLEPAVR